MGSEGVNKFLGGPGACFPRKTEKTWIALDCILHF